MRTGNDDERAWARRLVLVIIAGLVLIGLWLVYAGLFVEEFSCTTDASGSRCVNRYDGDAIIGVAFVCLAAVVAVSVVLRSRRFRGSQ